MRLIQRGGIDFILALALAGVSCLVVAHWAVGVVRRQRQAFAVFGVADDGPAYCTETLRNTSDTCIPRRSDHGAPGRRGRSPDAVCALLAGAAVSAAALGLPPCD